METRPEDEAFSIPPGTLKAGDQLRILGMPVVIDTRVPNNQVQIGYPVHIRRVDVNMSDAQLAATLDRLENRPLSEFDEAFPPHGR